MMKHLLIVLAAETLTGCEVRPMRQSVEAQCQRIASELEVAPQLVEPVCQCTANKVIETSSKVTFVSNARMKESVNFCL